MISFMRIEWSFIFCKRLMGLNSHLIIRDSGSDFSSEGLIFAYQHLVKIGPVVLEKKMLMHNGQQITTDNR